MKLEHNKNIHKISDDPSEITPRFPRLSHTLLRSLHKITSPGGFRFRLLMLIMLIAGISTLLIDGYAKADTTIQEGIAQKVLRFHVIANSDSEADQQLKLKVKEALVEYLTPQLRDIENINKVKGIVANQLSDVQIIAEQVIREHGYDYSVAVSLERSYFPLKVYGNYAFPPGYYEALRVRIGKAEGRNWWCVMFPPLCFVDETYSIVDENSKEKLLQLLSEEEYDALISGKTPVKIHFKLFEQIKELFE
jgi:stage II sporulation protein R